MGYDTEITMYIVTVLVIYGLVKWIQHRPLPPDPWDGVSRYHDQDDVLNIDAVVIPSCNKCGTPLEDPDGIVCKKCGSPIGDVSRGKLFTYYLKRVKLIKAFRSLFFG